MSPAEVFTSAQAAEMAVKFAHDFKNDLKDTADLLKKIHATEQVSE